MTRNSRKFQKQNNSGSRQEQDKDQAIKDNILSKLSFIASTETVELPTKGLYYPIDSPLYDVAEVEVKHMTAKEEDILSSLTAVNSKELFTRIVQSILVKPDVDANLFCEQDLTAILLSARATCFGKNFVMSELCLGCGTMADFEFDLSKREVTNPNEGKVEYDPHTNSIELMLPALEMKVKAKILSDDDVDALDREKAKKEELGIEYNRTTSFLKACIIAVQGYNDETLIRELVENMPAIDALYLKEKYLDFRPKLNTMQEVACQSCGAINRREVPASWAFFRPDKSIHRKDNL